MKDQHVTLHGSPDAITNGVVTALAKIAESPERQRRITHGYEAHGIAFLAFLLVPGVNDIPAEELTELFVEMHCYIGETEIEALEAMVEKQNWDHALAGFLAETGLDLEALRFDYECLRESFSDQYEFVAIEQKCHVFELAPLNERLKS